MEKQKNKNIAFDFVRIELSELEDLMEKVLKDVNNCILALKQELEIVKDS